MANKLSDKSTSQLNAMLNKGSGASQKEVRAAITELKKRGEDTPPPSLVMGGRREMSKGGKATKKVPVISIGVGMAEMPKGKAKMMRGGMSGGKEHMYAAGGMVKDNPGLKALKAASPEAYKKITGK
jgi:hypothetical protein